MSRRELIALVAERDARIAAQDTQIATLSTQVTGLVEANEQLAANLARLEHLLSRNSSNSSMPPSKDDDPGRKPPAEKPRRQAGDPKRKRGKQPGASGANLAWVDNPTKQIDRFPRGHCECGHDLAEATDLGVVDRYQQHEIPQMSVTVTQYDQHQVRCGCGEIHTAARPEGARTGTVGYGPEPAGLRGLSHGRALRARQAVLGPQVEDVMQVHVGEQWGCYAPNAMGNFCFDVTLSYRRLERSRRVTDGA